MIACLWVSGLRVLMPYSGHQIGRLLCFDIVSESRIERGSFQGDKIRTDFHMGAAGQREKPCESKGQRDCRRQAIQSCTPERDR